MPSFTGEPAMSPFMRPKNTTSSVPFRSLAALAALALAGCTSTTKDNFTNPPPGPPSSCAQVAALAGCSAGALSFSCSSDRPDDGDTNLVCDRGTPGDDGSSTLYCCAPYGQWATECVPASDVPGCGAQSLGFACTGETAPDQVDVSLVCSQAIRSTSGVTDYCCVPADQASGICRCASFDEDAGACGTASTGCSGASIGFTCAAGHSPVDVNPVLACDGGAPDAGGAGSYCCQTP
jgi:hypothetical protein